MSAININDYTVVSQKYWCTINFWEVNMILDSF